MKAKIYTEIICKEFCKYYKEGREELHCGGYELIRNNLTFQELKANLELLRPDADLKNHMKGTVPLRKRDCPLCSEDEELKNLVCEKCDFFIDGCDYSDNRSGPPCGGYVIIELLLK